MSLPKELRNEIYQYVLGDNIDHAHGPSKSDWHVEAWLEKESLGITSDRLAPPFEDTVLPCRELHTERKLMHAATYRS